MNFLRDFLEDLWSDIRFLYEYLKVYLLGIAVLALLGGSVMWLNYYWPSALELSVHNKTWWINQECEHLVKSVEGDFESDPTPYLVVTEGCYIAYKSFKIWVQVEDGGTIDCEVSLEIWQTVDLGDEYSVYSNSVSLCQTVFYH